MRRATFVTTALAAMALAPAAFGQAHRHAETGPHGMPIQDVAGVHAELVVADRALTVYIYDEDSKPVRVTGFSGSALVGTGSARQVVQLATTGENALSGTAQNAIPRGTPITLMLKASNGRSGQARFTASAS